MGLFDKVFGTRSQREVKKIQPLVNKILALENEYGALSEEALKGKTAEFKDRLAQGETLDDLLVEAIADGCHIPRELFALLLKIKGSDRVIHEMMGL